MSTTAIGYSPENNTKFLESLLADLKILSAETKKKYPQIKEVSRSRTRTRIFGSGSRRQYANARSNF